MATTSTHPAPARMWWEASPRLTKPASPKTDPTISKQSPMGLHNPTNLPYDGADYAGQHNQQWMPGLFSGDTTIGSYQRDTLVARIRDLVRNDGWASGAITRILDSTLGVSLRPVSKPNHRFLKHMSGNSRFDSVWAAEFASFIDAHWEAWANDPGRYNDAERMLTFGQMMHLGQRHLLTDGDVLALVPWMEERIGRGQARYATTVQLIDPDRLSNPNTGIDLATLRNGVEIDPETGVPLFYYIRHAHQNDYFSPEKSVEWARYPKETETGRPIVAHFFEHHQAGQHRGGAGIFAPVITRMKMLARYDSAELDAAIVNAIFAAFVETPYDQNSTAEALAAPANSAANGYPASWGDWEARTAWNDGRNLSMQGSRLPMLLPGERINAVTAARPANGFKDFEKAVLRNVASAAGLAPMQVSNDWSDVNYSSARGALLEAWKTTDRRRADFCTGFASTIRRAWLEECMESDRPPLPIHGDVPHFLDAVYGYARVKWLGPGRGWIDPTKEREGSIMGIQAGLSTMEDESASNEGRNWEDTLDQLTIEKAAFEKAGLSLPTLDKRSPDSDSANSGDTNDG